MIPSGSLRNVDMSTASFRLLPGGHFPHALKQYPSVFPFPIMYFGFFSHSPVLAHPSHCSFTSSHTPSGNLKEFAASKDLRCIHFVALHFVPLITGHPP